QHLAGVFDRRVFELTAADRAVDFSRRHQHERAFVTRRGACGGGDVDDDDAVFAGEKALQTVLQKVHFILLAHPSAGKSLTVRATYWAVQPPSTEIWVPLIDFAASEARNRAMAATSSVPTNSLVGWNFSMTSLFTSASLMPRALAVSGICFSTSGVST